MKESLEIVLNAFRKADLRAAAGYVDGRDALRVTVKSPYHRCVLILEMKNSLLNVEYKFDFVPIETHRGDSHAQAIMSQLNSVKKDLESYAKDAQLFVQKIQRAIASLH